MMNEDYVAAKKIYDEVLVPLETLVKGEGGLTPMLKFQWRERIMLAESQMRGIQVRLDAEKAQSSEDYPHAELYLWFCEAYEWCKELRDALKK